MKVKIVLNGGFKSCCSEYSAKYISDVMKSWFSDNDGVDIAVIDKKEEDWAQDELSLLGAKYFSDRIYPLVFIEDVLVTMGNLPDRNILLSMVNDKLPKGITEEDIIKAAKENGVFFNE